jgi:hypothetical protein
VCVADGDSIGGGGITKMMMEIEGGLLLTGQRIH